MLSVKIPQEATPASVMMATAVMGSHAEVTGRLDIHVALRVGTVLAASLAS